MTDEREEIAEGVVKSQWNGENYHAIASSGMWKVALLNHGPRFNAHGRSERHLKTDEVFVLLDGSVTLWVGSEQKPVRLERFAAYCVQKGVWHRVTTQPGARCLVVENSDTGPDNTEYFDFTGGKS